MENHCYRYIRPPPFQDAMDDKGEFEVDPRILSRRTRRTASEVYREARTRLKRALYAVVRTMEVLDPGREVDTLSVIT
jgi:hypothetical protein